MTSWCQNSLLEFRDLQVHATALHWLQCQFWDINPINPAPTPQAIICSLDFRWFWDDFNVFQDSWLGMLLCLSASPLQVPTCLPCRSGEEMGGNHKVKPGDPEWRWMNGRSTVLLQFSYEFCLRSVWVLVRKKLEKWIHDSSLFTQRLHRCVGNLLSHWVCNTDPQGSQAAPRLQHQWGDSIPERWPLWAWIRLSSLSCFGLNV